MLICLVLLDHGMFTVALRKLYSLAAALPQVVEFRSPRFSAPDRPDIKNVRRMQREDSFHALVRNNTPNGKGFAHPATFTRNNRARKDLYTGFIALLDLAVHIDCIAYLKIRYLFLEAFAFHRIQNFGFHNLSLVLYTNYRSPPSRG